MDATPPPGWYPDPWRQAPFRWWSGSRWEAPTWPLAAQVPLAPAIRPVTPVVRRLSAYGLGLAVASLVASVILSYFGDAGRAGIETCSARQSPLLGWAAATLLCGIGSGAAGLGASVRVFRAKEGFWRTSPRAAGIVLWIIGVPLAFVALVGAAFSYACFF